MPRGTTVTIPDEVDLAIRAEAYRLGCRPGDVLVRWLRATFPDYVRDQLRGDLRHPNAHAVLDIEVVDSDGPRHAATPPTLAEGASGLTSPQDQADASVPGDGIKPEPDDAAPT
jgi:hypothetical protein